MNWEKARKIVIRSILLTKEKILLPVPTTMDGMCIFGILIGGLKKAINLSNLNCATTTVYTIDETGSNVDVHSKAVILFIPQIPEIENYLRGELNDFFRAHQFVGNEMAEQRETENAN